MSSFTYAGKYNFYHLHIGLVFSGWRGSLNDPGKRSTCVTGTAHLKHRSIASEDPQFAIRIYLELLVGDSNGRN